MYAYINMYNKLTNRVRALKSTSGLLHQWLFVDITTSHPKTQIWICRLSRLM